MESLKTAVVVTVLLVVGYAVYQAIQHNASPFPSKDAGDGFANAPSTDKGPSKRAEPEKVPLGEKIPPRDGTARDITPPDISRRDVSPRDLPPRDVASRDLPQRRPMVDVGPPSRDESAPGGARREWPDNVSPSRSREVDNVTADRNAADRRRPAASPSNLDSPPDPFATGTRRPPLAAQRPEVREGEPVRKASYEVREAFRGMMDEAKRRLDQGYLSEVHLSLSSFSDDPGLTPEQSRELMGLLNGLAGQILYSRQSILDEPHVVQQGETLQQIAAKYNVPWQLLKKINGVRDPDRLEPGRKLKVLHGPFNATVSLERGEMELKLAGYYAGRFPIGLGRDLPRDLKDSYKVTRKVVGPSYSGPDGTIRGGDPSNPLGGYWIELDRQLGIHGTNDAKNLGRPDAPGCICLGPRDIEDVFDILSAPSEGAEGSTVTIKR
jgi:hypothetical protein